ncbi:C4b-binding protein alpha chain-like [Chiloscyllium plagiosum]|uniref:C4b-binding protein alpha chain-like n=1 Tax=Chiloscyllium plagiosum TaxID=36176 RepID=UPI001CB80C6E|nr:C4b-binding protein alpha chain-like [Chiloscyllium plagiosum]
MEYPKCDCGKPPVLENGSPVNPLTTFPVGTNITYKCNPGYLFQEGGSKLITCRKDGTWSPLRAVCEPLNCGNPGEILNGYYNASEGTTFGREVVFYCDEGFRIVGTNFRICKADGWSGQVPTCEIVQCPEPPRISNGTVSSSDSDSWPFGSIARYSCLDGYSLIGEETITCTATGEWDKDPPRCQGDCGKPPVLENGSPVNPLTTFPVGTNITYKCNPGYLFQEGGSKLITCRKDGTWSPLRAVCEPSNLVTTLATTHTGGCERHIGQQLGLLLILGLTAAFLT